MICSMIPAGRSGIGIAVLSYADKIQFTVNIDTSIGVKAQLINDFFIREVNKLIEMADKVPAANEESKKDK